MTNVLNLSILLYSQIVLTALFAAACAAPSNYGIAPAVAIGAPVAIAAAAPAPQVYQPAAISLPAPQITSRKDPDVTTVHKPAPIVNEQIHYGTTTYVSGYNTRILKPAIPDIKIAVPTALKGTQTYNAPIVKVQKEIHTVNEPVPVQKPYDAPYEVIKPVERIVEVPKPYHVAKPVPYGVPTPVLGQPIIKKTVGPAIVRHRHTNVVAQPAIAHVGYAAQPAIAAVAQPALVAAAPTKY